MAEIKTFKRMASAAPSGGFLYVEDEEQVQLQRKVVWELIASFGKNVVSAKNLTNISLPVQIFEPRSYLARLVDGWWAAPLYLTRAAQTTDPVERLKLVITFAVAGFHNTCTQLKPFNPILGETYQANFADGTKIYCEQSSHHPPVTNWQLFGPDNLYKFYGYGEWTAGFRVNTVKGHQQGLHFVEFQDGTIITYNLPHMNVHGILMGERVVEYEGTMEFRDEKNRLRCDLTLNPKEESKGFLGWFSKSKIPSDYIKGQIIRVPSGSSSVSSAGSSSSSKKKGIVDGEVLCEVLGTWLGCVEFDGERYWDFEDDLTVYEAIPEENPLPSDCRFREDICFLAAGEIQKSSETKTELEEKQRTEAKMRREGAEQRKKAKKKDRTPRIVTKEEIAQNSTTAQENGSGSKKGKKKKGSKKGKKKGSKRGEKDKQKESGDADDNASD